MKVTVEGTREELRNLACLFEEEALTDEELVAAIIEKETTNAASLGVKVEVEVKLTN